MTRPFVASHVNLGPARGPRLALVAHMAEGGNTVAYLAKPNPNGVSVHFVIERSGRTVQMLDLDRMHTSLRTSAIRTTDDPDGFYGASVARAVMGDWADTRESLGPNHASIAVEVEGFARNGPNVAQHLALGALWRDLRDQFPGIRALGHRDFAAYKACPGQKVDWAVMGGHGPAPVPVPGPEQVPAAYVPNLAPMELRRLVQVPPGVRLIRADGSPHSTSPGVDLGLIAGVGPYFLVRSGGAAAYVRRDECGDIRPGTSEVVA